MDKFTLNVIDLLIAEPEYCTGHVFDSPQDLIDGFLDEGDDLGPAGKLKGKRPIDRIIFVLRRQPHWGEFLGAVLASLSTWGKRDLDAVMPQLMKTVAKAAKHGVDH